MEADQLPWLPRGRLLRQWRVGEPQTLGHRFSGRARGDCREAAVPCKKPRQKSGVCVAIIGLGSPCPPTTEKLTVTVGAGSNTCDADFTFMPISTRVAGGLIATIHRGRRSLRFPERRRVHGPR